MKLVIDEAVLGKITPASYQTAPLVAYCPVLRQRASDLFHRVRNLVGDSRAKEYKGSFSILAATSAYTAAKIMIYEAGKGKLNGHSPSLDEGICILIRVAPAVAACTIGVAPKHHERFAYFQLTSEQNLDELAAFIAGCASAQ